MVLKFRHTQSQLKRNFSSWIFPGAQGQVHVTRGHQKSAYGLFGKLLIWTLPKWRIPPYSLVYTLLQKKGNFKKVAFLLRLSVWTSLRWGDVLIPNTTYKQAGLLDLSEIFWGDRGFFAVFSTYPSVPICGRIPYQCSGLNVQYASVCPFGKTGLVMQRDWGFRPRV